MKKLFNLLCVAALLIGCVGCKSTLETGGAYAVEGFAPDKGFYIVDASFDLAFSTVQGAFKFERDNRAVLWAESHEIKHTLDKARPVAQTVLRDYSNARAAYLANPTPAGLTTLQLTLSKMQAVTSAVLTVPELRSKLSTK